MGRRSSQREADKKENVPGNLFPSRTQSPYERKCIHICMCTLSAIDNMLLLSSAKPMIIRKQEVPCLESKTCTISVMVHNGLAVKLCVIFGMVGTRMV